MPVSQNSCLDDLLREVLDIKLSEVSAGGGGGTTIFPPVSSEILFDEELVVAAGTPITVLSYANPSFKLYMDTLLVEGNIDAEWEMFIDTVRKSKWRTDQMSGTRDIPLGSGQILAVGSTVEIKVTHHLTGQTGDFSATIFGHRR